MLDFCQREGPLLSATHIRAAPISIHPVKSVYRTQYIANSGVTLRKIIYIHIHLYTLGFLQNSFQQEHICASVTQVKENVSLTIKPCL